MSRSGLVYFFAFCGVLVSVAVFLAGALAVNGVLVDFAHQQQFSRSHPALNLYPEDSLLNRSFLYICLTLMLSIIFGATAAGLLRGRAWAARAAKVVVPCVSWLLFLGAVWSYQSAPRLSSDAMLVVGPGLIEAILAFYVLPWFVVISTLWVILLARKSSTPRDSRQITT